MASFRIHESIHCTGATASSSRCVETNCHRSSVVKQNLVYMNPKLLALETCIMCITSGTNKLHPSFDSRLRRSRERNARPNSNMSAGWNRHKDATDGASHLQHLGPYQLNILLASQERNRRATSKLRRVGACPSSLHNRYDSGIQSGGSGGTSICGIETHGMMLSIVSDGRTRGDEGGRRGASQVPVCSLVYEPRQKFVARQKSRVAGRPSLHTSCVLYHPLRKRGGVIHENQAADLVAE